MTIGIEPLHPLYAARLTGVDIREPVDETTMSEVRAALASYAVCVIGHDEPPTNEQHIAFSGRLGPLERGKSPKIKGTEVRLPYPEIVDQSNLNDVGEIYADDDRRDISRRLLGPRPSSRICVLFGMLCRKHAGLGSKI